MKLRPDHRASGVRDPGSGSGSRSSKALYNAEAEEWAAACQSEKLTRRRAHMVAFIARHATSGTLLDIGCGDGSLCLDLARRGFDVYGCDVAEALVSIARRRLGPVVADAENRVRLIEDNVIPFDRRFDVISILGVMVYIPRHADYLRQMTTRLAPGGLLVASCTQRCSLRTGYDLGRNLRRPSLDPRWRAGIKNQILTGAWSGGCMPYRGSGRTYSVGRLERVMRGAGLTPVDRHYVFDIQWLDRHPLDRTAWMSWWARRLGWRQTVAACYGVASAGADLGRSGRPAGASPPDPLP